MNITEVNAIEHYFRGSAPIPKLSSIFSKGQNLVNEDCNKFIPTNAARNNQLMFMKYASMILTNTKLPATARTILSFMIIFFS